MNVPAIMVAVIMTASTLLVAFTVDVILDLNFRAVTTRNVEVGDSARRMYLFMFAKNGCSFSFLQELSHSSLVLVKFICTNYDSVLFDKSHLFPPFL